MTGLASRPGASARSRGSSSRCAPQGALDASTARLTTIDGAWQALVTSAPGSVPTTPACASSTTSTLTSRGSARRSRRAAGTSTSPARPTRRPPTSPRSAVVRAPSWRPSRSRWLSEEIGLNGALEAAACASVETDLGEYIVQLAGEHPVHIIAPAIDKTRRRMPRRCSRASRATPVAGGAEALTPAARRQLREGSCAADVGITGANFGVAETGSLVPGHERGQRPARQRAAARPRRGDGDGAARRRPGRPRRAPALLARSGDGPAADDLHDAAHRARGGPASRTGPRSCTS